MTLAVDFGEGIDWVAEGEDGKNAKPRYVERGTEDGDNIAVSRNLSGDHLVYSLH